MYQLADFWGQDNKQNLTTDENIKPQIENGCVIIGPCFLSLIVFDAQTVPTTQLSR